LQLLSRELDESGFSGVEVRRAQTKTEIIIRAARTQDVLGAWRRRWPRHCLSAAIACICMLVAHWMYSDGHFDGAVLRCCCVLTLRVACGAAGEKGRRIRELTRIVQKRFNIPDGTVELYGERIATRGLCAQTQAESLKCVPHCTQPHSVDAAAALCTQQPACLSWMVPAMSVYNVPSLGWDREWDAAASDACCLRLLLRAAAGSSCSARCPCVVRRTRS
jgi:hypothetical protein